jgi:hypothetical protein
MCGIILSSVAKMADGTETRAASGITMTERANDLWAITSYYNPLSYKSRHTNYRIFRERLGVPLVTVELAYGPRFELGEGDADILIQLRGGDVLWQKERLLNLALDALPAECTKVAWIDCDVLFGDDDWPKETSRVLDRVPIAQLFSKAYYLPAYVEPWPLDSKRAEQQRTSIAYAAASGLNAESCLEEGNGRSVGACSPGIAWAARRELLQGFRFYDACVIGGGDRNLAAAVYDCFEHVARRQRLNNRQFEHFVAWAKPLRDAVGGAVGCVEGNLFHLWHGALERRRWYARYETMPLFRFDPSEDIALTLNGLWRWNSQKPDLHAYVHDHFVLRREDG